MAKARRPERIAILGGGPSALVAAWRLTQEKDWAKKYEITIYQQGWRVGGKCATGRDLDRHMRIYEHGIHGFLGCYFNALSVMKEVYDELKRPDGHPLSSFEKAFHGMSGVIRYEMVKGEVRKWPIHVPTNKLHRAKIDRKTVEALASLDTYSLNMIRLGLGFMLQAWAKTYRNPHTQKYVMENFRAPPADGKHPMVSNPPCGCDCECGKTCPRCAPDKVSYDTRIFDGKETTNRMLREAVETVLRVTPPPGEKPSPKALVKAMKTAAAVFNRLSETFAAIVLAGGGDSDSERDRIRRAGLALNFIATILTGVVADGVLFKGFAHLDRMDHREWLEKHGARPDTIASPLTSSTPNITYQYPNGDSLRQPVMAAGAYLHWTMMSFTYMGEFIQLFEAGSGETLIAPLHEALAKKGVKFAFFHCVKEIHADRKTKTVDRIEIDIQATVKGGKEYDPYVEVNGLKCWPDRPLYDQLVEGEALKCTGADLESFWCDWAPVGRKTLKCGEDFDKVILGISVGALPFLTKSLARAHRPWARMLDHAVTVSTQAMQLWLNRTPWELGWNGYTNDYDDYLLSANFMTQPNGQGDFTKYIRFEDWPANHKPAAMLMLCGTLPFYHRITGEEGPDFPRRLAEQVKAQSIQFLQATGGHMLPGATVAARKGYGDPFAFDFDLLHPVKPERGARKEGVERFDDQYWRVNVNPSDNYVSTPPGSTRYRLWANDTGFANLSIAGDWARNGLNVGSMEGAVRSGLLAAEAILGVPHEETGVIGFNPAISRG